MKDKKHLLFSIEQVKREILSGGEAIKALEILKRDIAALESEPEPLAEVEGHIRRELGGSHRNHILLPLYFGCDSGLPVNHGRPVTVTITERKQ